MDEQTQVELVGKLKQEWAEQYDTLPRLAADASADGFFLENQMFGSVDAELLYSMVRHVKPKRIVEIGAGWTTLLVLRVFEDMRADGEDIPMFESVDPNAPGFVYGRDDVHINTQRLQEMNILNSLKPGDMLLCDTSHVWTEGHEIDITLKKLPSLKGVTVHFHDIFLPDDYPPQWSERGYDEQVHLKAFLEAHPEWRILLAANELHKTEPDVLKDAITSYDPTRAIGPGSFWMYADPPRPAKRTKKPITKKRTE